MRRKLTVDEPQLRRLLKQLPDLLNPTASSRGEIEKEERR
jgi:hypothetical protein